MILYFAMPNAVLLQVWFIFVVIVPVIATCPEINCMKRKIGILRSDCITMVTNRALNLHDVVFMLNLLHEEAMLQSIVIVIVTTLLLNKRK